MHLPTLLLLAPAFLTASVNAVQYHLQYDHSGSTFFDGWNFIEGPDVNDTSTWVDYQSRENAFAKQLAFLNPAGNIILKVDNTTSGGGDPTFNRSSIEIISKETIGPGNLLVMDAVHMPYGCSTWPAFWTEGAAWPDDGEIDIVENINLADHNQIALHTLNGCRHPEDGSLIETGNLVATDCFNQTNHDEGCLIADPSTTSYGAGFAANGGGAYALLWDEYGMRIWFFERQNIPADLLTPNPDPDGWGLPRAAYPQSDCDFATFFKKQSIVLDINICGEFVNSFPGTCVGPVTGQCTDFVNVPSTYDQAYFEIKFVRVFTNDPTLVPAATTTSPQPDGASESFTGTVTVTVAATKPSNTQPKNGVAKSFSTSLLTLALAAALPAFGALLTIAW